jgi:hypothetical protein
VAGLQQELYALEFALRYVVAPLLSVMTMMMVVVVALGLIVLVPFGVLIYDLVLLIHPYCCQSNL